MLDCHFEKVARFADDESIQLPERKTANAAGYDFVVAEDTVIPSYVRLLDKIEAAFWDDYLNIREELPMEERSTHAAEYAKRALSLSEVADLTKLTKAKPTLVPTGVKCKLPADMYLELSARSSCPLKYWLILANGVGIIDADYYGNESNDGEIFFQMINLFPYDIVLKKGDIIGQGIIKPYFTVENDTACGTRTGGFGSTSV